jgi:hypothetical protein
MLESPSKVAIFGIGNIGRRHLESLVCQNFDIYIFDKSEDNLNYIRRNIFTKKIKLISNNLKDFDVNLDLAIISTDSKNRLELIRHIQQEIVVKKWLIEKLLASNFIELAAYENLTFTDNAWVNLPRRRMQCWKFIKEEIERTDIEHVKISGSNWGLVTNSIHFINLFEWFSSINLTEINLLNLPHLWYSSKRKGYLEVDGVFECNFANFFRIELVQSVECSEFFEIEIFTGKGLYKIKMDNQDLVFTYPNSSSRALKEDLISESSGFIAQDILSETKKMNLPTLEDSLRVHKILMSSYQTSFMARSNVYEKEFRLEFLVT